MNVIIFIENGSVCVMTPSPSLDLTIEEVAQKDVPKGCDWIVVDSESLPKDGPQETWSILDDNVVIDDSKMNEYLSREAKIKQTELLSDFWASTENWRLDAQMEDISESDKSKLKSWITWRKDVESVDTSKVTITSPVNFPPAPDK
ncbi:tail fiber assembly protein [Yersinia intermedia]|uniref:tail fiber assembly protein n=1 Tax=Yersinia intermedia TaxID=631 RepID=UPI00067BB087|nr:tail fiber assembly protein [Yersinia intermedia]